MSFPNLKVIESETNGVFNLEFEVRFITITNHLLFKIESKMFFQISSVTEIVILKYILKFNIIGKHF